MSLVNSLASLIWGFGVYIIIYALLFLACLPLLAHPYHNGADIALHLKRVAWLCAVLSLILTLLGFWLDQIWDFERILRGV